MVILISISVGAASPNPPVGLLVNGITHNSATIQWTVTSLSYGPETYVVQYGTDMNNLKQTSSMETSGDDITRTNFDLSVGLTGLRLLTTYYYRVLAMNDGSGVTQSGTETFNTTLLGIAILLYFLISYIIIIIFLQFLNHQILLKELPVPIQLSLHLSVSPGCLLMSQTEIFLIIMSPVSLSLRV